MWDVGSGMLETLVPLKPIASTDCGLPEDLPAWFLHRYIRPRTTLAITPGEESLRSTRIWLLAREPAASDGADRTW